MKSRTPWCLIATDYITGLHEVLGSLRAQGPYWRQNTLLVFINFFWRGDNLVSSTSVLLFETSTMARCIYVIGVHLPGQSASRKHNQEKKQPTNLCATRPFLQNVSTIFENTILKKVTNSLLCYPNLNTLYTLMEVR